MKLKTAGLGLNDASRNLLEMVEISDYFQIEAVADKNTQLAEDTAKHYECKAYDDYRQLLTANQFDCLLVADALHNCDEYIKTAIKKKTNILKLPPLARSFEEGFEFVRLAENQGVKFAIANPAGFAKSWSKLQKFVQEGQIENISFLTALYQVGAEKYPQWQGDPKLAGGGVLLHNCYELIDQITQNFKLPQQIYAISTNTAGDKQQRLCLTEDTAVITMRFSDTFFGNVTASRVFGPKKCVLKLYGENKILEVSDTRFAVSDVIGQLKSESEYDDKELCWKKLLENFALSILKPNENTLYGTARTNLMNMAVIESAYLSARTRFPEEPGRVLQIVEDEPTNIWPVHK